MLEYWNYGFWNTELMGYWSAAGGTVEFKMDYIHLLANIPSFHYSMIESKT